MVQSVRVPVGATAPTAFACCPSSSARPVNARLPARCLPPPESAEIGIATSGIRGLANGAAVHAPLATALATPLPGRRDIGQHVTTGELACAAVVQR